MRGSNTADCSVVDGRLGLASCSHDTRKFGADTNVGGFSKYGVRCGAAGDMLWWCSGAG